MKYITLIFLISLYISNVAAQSTNSNEIIIKNKSLKNLGLEFVKYYNSNYCKYVNQRYSKFNVHYTARLMKVFEKQRSLSGFFPPKIILEEIINVNGKKLYTSSQFDVEEKDGIYYLKTNLHDSLVVSKGWAHKEYFGKYEARLTQKIDTNKSEFVGTWSRMHEYIIDIRKPEDSNLHSIAEIKDYLIKANRQRSNHVSYTLSIRDNGEVFNKLSFTNFYQYGGDVVNFTYKYYGKWEITNDDLLKIIPETIDSENKISFFLLNENRLYLEAFEIGAKRTTKINYDDVFVKN